MFFRKVEAVVCCVLALIVACPAFGANMDPTPEEIRSGLKEATPIWPRTAFEALPRIWNLDIEPGTPEFRLELLKRYGLVYDPSFPNDGLPAGLTQTTTPYRSSLFVRGVPGITTNCQMCHSTQVGDRFVPGIGN